MIVNILDETAMGVVSNSKTAGERMQHTLDLPIPFNQPANDAIAFISSLKHHNDNIAVDFDEPIVLAEWQEQLVRTLFGTLDENGRRRFRTVYLTVAGKNGKSWLSAVILVYYLLCIKQNQSIISIAASREQAAVIFKQAEGILQQAGYVDDGTVTVSDFHKRITNNKNGNVYKIKTAKPKTLDGEIIDVVCFDELHRVDHAAELWAIVAKGMANKKEPLLLVTTTAGFDQSSYSFQKNKEAKQIIAGELEAPSVLPFIYEIPTEADIYDEKNWPLANPALLGAKPFLDIGMLRIAADSARRNPIDELTFRRFHANQFTDAEVSWISHNLWDDCKGIVNEQELEGSIAYAGLDYAPVNDLSVLVLVVPRDGKYHVICRAWLPKANIQQKSEHDGIDYLRWVRAGVLKLTEGDTTSLATINAEILELAKTYQIQRMDCDPFNTVQLSQQLREQGLNVFDHPQTCALMHYPCQQTHRAILEQRIVHDGNPLLRHCVVNTVVKLDDGMRMRPDKKKSNGKIDGMIGLVMAIGAAEIQEQKPAVNPDDAFNRPMVWV